MKKRLSLLMVLMMVMSLVPMSVFAAAGTMPGGRLEFDDNESALNEQVTVKLTQAAYTEITGGRAARLTLSNGAEFNAGSTVKFNTGGDSIEAPIATTTSAVIAGTITNDTAFKDVAYIDVPAGGIKTLSDDMDIILDLRVDFDELSAGDVTLSVEEVGSSNLKVADPIKIAVIKEGLGDNLAMVVSDATKKVGQDGGELSKVEIKKFDKSSPATNTLVLELPDYINWDLAKTKVTVDGISQTPATTADDNIVTITVPATAKAVLVTPFVTVSKRDSSDGDINLKVTSRNGATKIETIDGTIGVLGNYDVTMTAVEKGKKEIPAIYGGEESTVKVKLKGVEGSFTENRTIEFTVKGADIVTTTNTNTSTSISGTTTEGIRPLGGKTEVVDTKAKDGIVEDGEFSLKMINPDTTAPIDPYAVKDFEFELKLKTNYAQNGAVTLMADGRDIGKLECELAKVTPAYTVEFDKVTPIKKGESLSTANIVIKEAKAGLFDTDEFLVINLRDQNKAGISFGTGYKVETTNGMKIDEDLTKNKSAKKSDEESIIIDIKSSSSKEAATITISDLVVLASGSAVDGEKLLDTYMVEVVSSDIQSGENAFQAANRLTVEDADKDPDYSKAYVKIVKEYGAVATTTVFKIGSKEYTVNGEAKTANEAPFISGKGYTMLPVRAVGEALGLKADWNSATKTATFSNDAKVASVVIGADTMYVNGTPVKLAAKAEIKNGSTFVELRSLASAFMVELEWDAATKSVTIKG